MISNRTGWYRGAYGFIWLAFYLRLSQLNNIAVEKSEMLTIDWFIRRGLVKLVTTNKDLNNHPLNSLLAYFFSLGLDGPVETLFALRWHSVLIGVLTVAAVIGLTRHWFGRRDSLIAGMLITTSAYHVALSQQARGYVGLVGFTLLGLFFALQAMQSQKKVYWLGFIIMAILNIYNHLYGLMAVGTIGLIGLILLLKQRSSWRLQSIWPLVSPLLLSLVVSYLIGISLYAPMLADTMTTVGQANQFRASDFRQAQTTPPLKLFRDSILETIKPFSLAQDSTRLLISKANFHYGPLDGLARLAEGSLGFYLTVCTILLGVIFSWRRFKLPVLICLVWILLPFLIQTVGYFILPGAYFRGRFLAFIYIPYFLLMARGWPALADWLKARWAGTDPNVSPAKSRFKPLVPKPAWLGLSLLIGLNLAWLNTFHTAAAQEHWADLAGQISSQLQPGDMVYCGQRSNTACSFDMTTRLGQTVKEMDDDFISLPQIRANPTYFDQPGRVWMVMPHLTSAQVAALTSHAASEGPADYQLFGNPAYDQAAWIRFDHGPTWGDNLITALEFGLKLSLNSSERLINAISLTEIHLARRKLDQAEKTLALAQAEFPGHEDAWQGVKYSTLLKQFEYAYRAAETAAELPETAIHINRNLAGLAQLMAYDLDRQILFPGQSLQVKLYWQALAPINDHLISYLYLTDLQANLVDKKQGVPAAGSAPTDTWQPGQIVIDTYTLTLPDQAHLVASGPLALKVEAGLFQPDTSTFVTAFDQTGQPTTSLIAKVSGMPSAQPTIAPNITVQTTFADLITLLGYDYLPQTDTLTLYWHAQAEIAEDYTVFIHLLNQDGELAGQIDGQPYQGQYPTSWWLSSQPIIDHRTIPDIEPGDYQVLLGWYHPITGRRLPLNNQAGDSLDLGLIQIP